MPNKYPSNWSIEKLKEMENSLMNSMNHPSTDENHFLISKIHLDWVKEEIRSRNA